MQQSLLNQMETTDNAEDNPALSKVVERNIRTIIRLRLEAARERGLQDRIADEDSELADLEMETKPEDVLAEIERLQEQISAGSYTLSIFKPT
jgi:hypothetical protein